MSFAQRHMSSVRAFVAAWILAVALLATVLVPRSTGDLQSRIAGARAAAASLQSSIATETARIQQTSGGLHEAEHRLAGIEVELRGREAQLRAVQGALIAARDHLVQLENRLRLASSALAANLRAAYENGRPNLMTVVLESHGFTDLLERMSFLGRVGRQDAQIVTYMRTARTAVFRQASGLAVLEKRDRTLADQVLTQRNQVGALRAALLTRQIAEVKVRSHDAGNLHRLHSRLHSLEARAAAEAARAASAGKGSVASTGSAVAGLAANAGGQAQPPAGAPASVAQVIAAGNAIATLPYVWGGGHGSFHASGYDCSGSVSYALAAGGLLGSPLDSTGFESWREPGPGRWITVYANAAHAFMVVAGWRFDTGALGSGGTRWSQSMRDTSGFVARHPPGL